MRGARVSDAAGSRHDGRRLGVRGRLYAGGFLIPLLMALAVMAGSPGSALAAGNPITGTVTDNNTGSPLAGITVTLETETAGVCTTTATTTTTGANGSYTLTPGADANNYVVEFNRGSVNPDYNDDFFQGSPDCGGATLLNTTGGPQTANDQLTNIPGSVTGTVTDASDNQPIKGVDVTATDAQHNVLGTATTAADGTYTIASVASGSDTVTFNGQNDLNFNAPSVNATVAPGATATTVNQALTPLSGHITGTVTAAGNPVANERVVLLSADGSSTQNATTTDSSGFYTLTDVPAGAHEVQFEPDAGQNFVPQYYNGKSGYASADTVSVTSNTTTPNINAALSQGGTITGTVADQLTGAGVGDIEIDVMGCTTSNCQTTTLTTPTNSVGQFTLTGLPTGTYYLEPANLGAGTNYVTPQYFTSQGPQGSPTGISVTAGQTTTANDALLVGGKITGQLVDGSGNPIAGEDVEAIAASGEQFFDPATAADGTYSISGLPSGTYKLEFFGNSSFVSEYFGGTESSATATPVSVTQGQTTANVNAAIPGAAAGGRISGTVAGPGGPLTGASVTLYDSAGHPLDLPTSTVTTDQDGTYRTPALLPGSYKVKFTSNSGNLGFQYYNLQTTLTAATAVGVSAGATTPGINGTLSAGGSIGGTVTDAISHLPVTGITVDLLSAGGEVLGSTTTAADGTYTLTGIPAGGAYHVEFDPSGVTIKGGDGILYAPQFWNDKTTLAGSAAVSVAAGVKTPNVNAALGTASSIPAVVTPTPTPSPRRRLRQSPESRRLPKPSSRVWARASRA